MYWKYLKYVLLHKWFVFLACREFGVNIFQALFHDWSKFLPDEFIPYAQYFYGDEKAENERTLEAQARFMAAEAAPFGWYRRDKFLVAWLLHQRRSPHHWQYWYLIQDNDPEMPIPMPEKYVREMLADWYGAGRAITGKWDAFSWYWKNEKKIRLHHETRTLVETLLSKKRSIFEIKNYPTFEMYLARKKE